MTAATEWARDFFSGIFVELWLRAIPESVTRQEADFLEKALEVKPAARLLDLACGGGRHCHELASRGYHMTGVDISPEFLARARSTATDTRLPITWEQRPIHDLPWENAFDGAYCMGNSLGGLDDAATAAFFRATARALKPGARFIVDTGVMAESILPNFKERSWWPAGDIYFLVENQYDYPQARLNMHFTLIQNGRVEKKSGFSQVYTYREFCRLIQAAGLTPTAAYSSPAEEPYRLGAHRLLLVATRPMA